MYICSTTPYVQEDLCTMWLTFKVVNKRRLTVLSKFEVSVACTYECDVHG